MKILTFCFLGFLSFASFGANICKITGVSEIEIDLYRTEGKEIENSLFMG